jgi:hypothetical protein
MARYKSLVIDPQGRRRLTRSEKIGIGSVATLIGVAALGVIAGVERIVEIQQPVQDDAGGEWDEGGGVETRWQ